MAQGVRNGAVAVMFCTASSVKNCYPCQWAKLLPMSRAGHGEKAGVLLAPDRFADAA